MKQIEQMFGRFIIDRPRLKKKWQMGYSVENGYPIIYFFHYHHIIAIYTPQGLAYEWHETRTDLRGLNEIKKYMSSDSTSMIYNRIREGSKYYELQIVRDRTTAIGDSSGTIVAI